MPTPFAVRTPALALVPAIVATVVGDVDQVIGTSAIGVPLPSRTTPETCVTSPIFSFVAFAVIEIMCTGAPAGVFVAESGEDEVESFPVGSAGVSGTSSSVTLTVIVRVTLSAVAEIVVDPVVVSAVTSPVAETAAMSRSATVQVRRGLSMTRPRASFTTAVACTCWPGVSDESGAESAMEKAR